MPDGRGTVALGAALIAGLVSIWIGTQALAQVAYEPEGLGDRLCTHPIEIVEEGVSRLGCAENVLTRDCGSLRAGDRVVLAGKACQIFSGAMAASMRLAVNLTLDINRVFAKDLELLDGVGPSLSSAIIEYRERLGEFNTLNDLLAVRGIGKKRLNGLRKHLSCARP